MIRARLVTAAATAAVALVAAPATAASGNLLKNPGFEKGTDVGWKQNCSCIETDDPHSGSWIAWMGGVGSAHTDTVKQTVSIPKGSKATVSFWLKTWSYEMAGSTDDTFKVRITNAAGKTRTVKSLSSADGGTPDARGDYVKYTADVSRYLGKTVKLAFVAHEDDGDATSFELDDTGLKVS
jgi:hypothetical protein